MFNAAYLNPQETDLEDLTTPLRINSCGIYRLDTRPVMKITRPYGREDYQLLYIVCGNMYITAAGHSITIPTGHMLLYYPGQAQYYSYYAQENAEVCWIHFTGNKVNEILQSYGWPGQAPPSDAAPHILPCGSLSEYKSLFLQIIRELQVLRPGFDALLPLLFQQLLLLTWRFQKENSPKHKRLRPENEQAVHYFHEHFASPIVIEDYAQSCHMSTCWFIRSFKQQMGTPPLQYLTAIRINRAIELLEGSQYSITEISNMVGIDNPLYFSKLFKKQTGQSPKEYRQNRF